MCKSFDASCPVKCKGHISITSRRNQGHPNPYIYIKSDSKFKTHPTMFKGDLESMKLNQTQPTNSTMFKEDLESMKLNQIMLSILRNVYTLTLCV